MPNCCLTTFCLSAYDLNCQFPGLVKEIHSFGGVSVMLVYTYFTLLLCFDVLGTNRGPTDRAQHIKALNDSKSGGHNRFST